MNFGKEEDSYASGYLKELQFYKKAIEDRIRMKKNPNSHAHKIKWTILIFRKKTNVNCMASDNSE